MEQNSFTPALQKQMPHIMRSIRYLLDIQDLTPSTEPQSTTDFFQYLRQAAAKNKTPQTARVTRMAPMFYRAEDHTLCGSFELSFPVVSENGWKLPCSLFANEKESQLVIGYDENQFGEGKCHGYFSTLGELAIPESFFQSCCHDLNAGNVLMIILSTAQELMKDVPKAAYDELMHYHKQLADVLAENEKVAQPLSPEAAAAWARGGLGNA